MINLRKHRDITKPVSPGAHFVRRDFFSANIVELGISLQQDFGTKYAAKFLKDNWISIDVAARVLLRPAERRRYN
ncbi:MAG: hypothetical protein JWQ23_3314 [Herminiimonas sp.]|nr:hypothetical protein [Herminiimonas sp.]